MNTMTDTTVQKTASVAPKTITEISEGKHEVKKARKKPVKKPKNGKLEAIKVDPRVWEVALELSQGDPKRLVIRSATEVSVLNPGVK